MNDVNLKISPDLKQWLSQAAEEDENISIILVKSEEVDELRFSWGMSVATPETIGLCGLDSNNVMEIDGLQCIVSHPELVEELRDKYLCWSERGMWLENNV